MALAAVIAVQHCVHFFEVDRYFVVVTALKALADQGAIKPTVVAKAIKEFGIDPEKSNPLYL